MTEEGTSLSVRTFFDLVYGVIYPSSPKINLGQAYVLQANNHKRELCKMEG